MIASFLSAQHNPSSVRGTWKQLPRELLELNCSLFLSFPRTDFFLFAKENPKSLTPVRNAVKDSAAE